MVGCNASANVTPKRCRLFVFHKIVNTCDQTSKDSRVRYQSHCMYDVRGPFDLSLLSRRCTDEEVQAFAEDHRGFMLACSVDRGLSLPYRGCNIASIVVTNRNGPSQFDKILKALRSCGLANALWLQPTPTTCEALTRTDHIATELFP
jgi:hypothetical protein